MILFRLSRLYSIIRTSAEFYPSNPGIMQGRGVFQLHLETSKNCLWIESWQENGKKPKGRWPFSDKWKYTIILGWRQSLV